MQTQGKLQNHHHHNRSRNLQQFHLNINYKKDNTNHVLDCLIRPLVLVLTTSVNSFGHNTYGWKNLYNSDFEFTARYKMLIVSKHVSYFHLQDVFLCYLHHLCVPSRKHGNLIKEAHYSWVEEHFGVEKELVVLQKYFYQLKFQQDIHRYIRLDTSHAISKLTIKKYGSYTPPPTRYKLQELVFLDYMSIFPSTMHGNDLCVCGYRLVL